MKKYWLKKKVWAPLKINYWLIKKVKHLVFVLVAQLEHLRHHLSQIQLQDNYNNKKLKSDSVKIVVTLISLHFLRALAKECGLRGRAQTRF